MKLILSIRSVALVSSGASSLASLEKLGVGCTGVDDSSAIPVCWSRSTNMTHRHLCNRRSNQRASPHLTLWRDQLRREIR